ncbi:MAG: hypothetical protein AAFP86_01740 [Planctomycetota bacterium]
MTSKHRSALAAWALVALAAPGAGAGAPRASVEPGPLVLHPNSFSWSNVFVRRGEVRVELRVQVLSLAEVVPGFDDDLDGHTDPDELAAAADDILAYVTEHYRVVPGAETAADAADTGRALVLRAGSVFEGPLIPDPLNEVADWIDIVLEYERPDVAFDRLGVHVDLFEATSPGHRDGCTVVWNGEVHADVWNFAVGNEGHVFPATEAMVARDAPPFARFARAGIRWLIGRDARAALVLALLLTLGARRALASGVGAAAAFFGATALGTVLAPSLPVEEFVGRFFGYGTVLSLVYLALDDLVHREGHTRLLEGVVFGFLAGVGAAVSVEPAVALEESPTLPLLGHALGAFGTGLAVACALGYALAKLPGERGALAPRALRAAAALAALAVAVDAYVHTRA